MFQRETRTADMTPTEVVQKFVSTWFRRKVNELGHPPFSLGDDVTNAHDLADRGSLLPIIGWHAWRVYKSSGCKLGMHATFHEDSAALLKYTVSFDRHTRSATELVLFITEALEDALLSLPKAKADPRLADLSSLTQMFSADMQRLSAPQIVTTPGA